MADFSNIFAANFHRFNIWRTKWQRARVPKNKIALVLCERLSHREWSCADVGKKIFNWKTFGYCANYNLINGRRGERIISFRHHLRRCFFHIFFVFNFFVFLVFYFGWMITGTTHSYQKPWKFWGWRWNRETPSSACQHTLENRHKTFSPYPFHYSFSMTNEKKNGKEKKVNWTSARVKLTFSPPVLSFVWLCFSVSSFLAGKFMPVFWFVRPLEQSFVKRYVTFYKFYVGAN